ncbi:MAG: YdcF family protein [Treponema sp.]|nr:YdcF family protein [Treponema sp.]
MQIKTPELIINILVRPLIIFAGAMCIWYFLALRNFIGYINQFNYIWLFAGVFFILLAVFIGLIIKLFFKMPKVIRVTAVSLIAAFVLSFIIIEGLVIINRKSSNYENADYVIILGAGLYREGPTYTLWRRINSAIIYSRNNPDVQIIVSGGTGEGQRVSEAEVMSRVLQSYGIGADRILIEDKSTNTYENISYSAAFINDTEAKIVIASSEFHLFRAKITAKRLGFKNVGTLASWTPRILLPNSLIREYMAVIKTLLFDSR